MTNRTPRNTRPRMTIPIRNRHRSQILQRTTIHIMIPPLPLRTRKRLHSVNPHRHNHSRRTQHRRAHRPSPSQPSKAITNQYQPPSRLVRPTSPLTTGSPSYTAHRISPESARNTNTHKQRTLHRKSRPNPRTVARTLHVLTAFVQPHYKFHP